MADTKISALAAAASFVDADMIPINEAGTTKEVTGTLLKAWVGDMLGGSASATLTPTAATLTYITGSNIAVPVGKLRIGTSFFWHLDYAKTGVGAATRTYDIRLGTLGTTGDAVVATYTTLASTAVIDQGFTDIYATCRGPLSASGIFQCSFFSGHNLQTTGLLAQQNHYVQVTSGSLDVTVANLIIGITTTSAASEAISYLQVIAEAKQL